MFSTKACMAQATAISRQLAVGRRQNELDHGALKAAGQCMMSN
jgi:hypothetical protein